MTSGYLHYIATTDRGTGVRSLPLHESVTKQTALCCFHYFEVSDFLKVLVQNDSTQSDFVCLKFALKSRDGSASNRKPRVTS